MTEDAIDVATRLAEGVLYPNAISVDAEQRSPRENLDALAEHGFYGGMLPRDVGGLGVDFVTANLLAEILASGCLSTTLVLGQHQGITATLASKGSHEQRQHWLPGLASGKIRTGAAFTGAIPGPARLTVRETSSGPRLNGTAPWVSGWSMIDLLGTAARDADDNIRWLLVDAEESATFRVTPLRMLAANATNTVVVEFVDHPVPAERLITVGSQAEHATSEPFTKRLNGALVLGVARRAVTLLDDPLWTSELDAVRADLDSMADIDSARARAGEFSLRATTAAVVKYGGSGVLADANAQRLLREAGLMLVFSSRPSIQADLLRRLASSDS